MSYNTATSTDLGMKQLYQHVNKKLPHVTVLAFRALAPSVLMCTHENDQSLGQSLQYIHKWPRTQALCGGREREPGTHCMRQKLSHDILLASYWGWSCQFLAAILSLCPADSSKSRPKLRHHGKSTRKCADISGKHKIMFGACACSVSLSRPHTEPGL